MKEKTTSCVSSETDHQYHELEKLIASRVAEAKGPLFATDAEGLFDLYLAGIPEESRQHYNCRSCQKFVERFGGLVEIPDDGTGVFDSLLWEDADPDFFKDSIINLRREVNKAKVTGVFLSSDKVWGTPVTGEWTHLSGTNPAPFKHGLLSASQAMAEKKEDHGMLCRGLAEYPAEAVVQAVRVLEADAVDRSEKTLGAAKWLLELHGKVKDVKGPRKNNLVWLAVATAPPGFCHVKTTMINTLLDDIVAGLPYESIKARWNEKMLRRASRCSGGKR
jgi:hypothetical protein